MQQRPIGNRTVSAIGLGEMPLSIEGRPDRAPGHRHHPRLARRGRHHHRHRRRLLARRAASTATARSSSPRRSPPTAVRPTTSSWRPRAGTAGPATAAGRCTATPPTSRRPARPRSSALGVDAIGLYQYHRPDPKVPWAESVGALADLLDEGKILMAGVSNATVDADRRGPARPRRPPGQRAEPVLAPLPLLGGRARALREARHRLHPLEPARRHRARRRHRAEPPGLRRGGHRGRRQPAAGHPGLDAGQGLPGHPHPGQQPPETAAASAAAADLALTRRAGGPTRRLLTRRLRNRTVTRRVAQVSSCARRESSGRGTQYGAGARNRRVRLPCLQ